MVSTVIRTADRVCLFDIGRSYICFFTFLLKKHGAQVIRVAGASVLPVNMVALDLCNFEIDSPKLNDITHS